ncbi:hypothetical protein LXA43DRAFT_1099061 [Ganoderma leucocontextum]|nr:hypothetical protein LXA43DRAFT_1099061 [Ganoderma leucocontextum]
MVHTRSRRASDSDSAIPAESQLRQSIVDDSNVILEIHHEDSPPPAEQPYGFRKGTRGRRPGQQAGLARRTREEIQDAAEKKKREKAAKQLTGVRKKAAEVAQHTAGAKAIAAMLDERARNEAQDVAQLDNVPLSDEEGTFNNQAPTQTTGTFTTVDGEQRRPPGADLGVDLDLAALDALDTPDRSRSPTDSGLQEPPEEEFAAWSGILDGGAEAEAEDDEAGIQSGHGSGDDFDSSSETPRARFQGSGASQRTFAAPRRSAGSTKEPVASAAQKSTKGPTAAEKRKARVTAVRGSIAAERETSGSTNALPTKRPTATGPKTPAKKTKLSTSTDAFNADYRRRIREGIKTPTVQSPRASSPAVQATLTILDDASDGLGAAPRRGGSTKAMHKVFPWDSPIPDPAPSTSKSSAPAINDQPLFDEEIGGFRDVDVSTTRTSVTARKTPTTKNIVGIVPDAIVVGDEVAQPPKKARAPRSQVSSTVSRALHTIPSWIQAAILTTVVPSLIKHYGARDDPWDLDGPRGMDHFSTVFHAILRAVHPDREHNVRPGDSLWRFVYDWRSNFGKIAIKTVKDEVDSYRKEYGTDAAITWVTNALARGGAATYSNPNLQDPKAARGALQTSYHIKLMAFHIQETEGSLLKNSYKIGLVVYDATYPVGALALAAVAIRRAFQACKSGSFVAPTTEFSADKCSGDTRKARDGSVAGLRTRTDRFDALLDAAMESVPSLNKAQATTLQHAEEDDSAFDAMDPSSSPVHSDL